MPNSQEDKEEKVSSRIFFWEFVLFSSTIFLGIVTAFRMSSVFRIQKINVSPIEPWQFILYFIIATLVVLFLAFFIKSSSVKGKIFKILFVFSVFWGGLLVLDIWLGDILALFLIIVLIYFWLKRPNVLVHNLCMVFAIAGVGAIAGLRIQPEIMVILLVIFSIYDLIAVYKTKHMQKMAKEMIKHGAVLALIIPPKREDFSGKIKEVKAGGKFLVLGGGDIAFPLLLSVSLVPQGIIYALIVAIFSLVGLFVSFIIFIKQKERKPIPALPPIALFSILGFLFTKITIFW